jgi:hypothetical protein
MQVTLKRDYACAPEGHTTYKYRKGDTVEGRVAELAVADGAASKPRKSTPKPENTKPAKPDETSENGPAEEG